MNTSVGQASRVLWLSLAINYPSGYPEAYSGFFRLAERRGCPLELLFDPGRSGALEEAVVEAPAYILSSSLESGGLSLYPPIGRVLEAELKKGKRFLVINGGSSWNHLLDSFGIAVTSHRLYLPPSSRNFDLKLVEQKVPILDGVQYLSVSSPTLINYGGLAEPLLELPDETAAYDIDDFPVALGRRRRVCGAT